MKPRILKVSGLNSFEEEQIIYFDKLTEKGLFGIFGPTGSGKSTILDAMTIALYGNVTRTNKGYINTATKNLTVSYEFEIGDGKDRRTYVAERNLKINNKGGYNTKYARLIDKTEVEDMIIAEKPNELEKEIERIIGLKGDDFTRSVVLPQGKFSEFLKLKGKDKRDMLERIFGLERYGKVLGDKIKSVKYKYLKESDILSGELKKYEGITEEGFKEKEEELERALKEEDAIKNEKQKLEEDYEKYKDIWELQKELKTLKKAEGVLNSKLKDINIKKISLEKGEKALKIKPCIDEVHKIKESIVKNLEEWEKVNSELKGIEEALKLTEESYNRVLKEKDETLPLLITKKADLNRAVEIYNAVSLIKVEREKLLEDYYGIKKNKDVVDKKIKLITENREETFKKVEDIEKRLNEIKIDPEYREKLQNALDKENEYNKVLKRNQELTLKVNAREVNIGKLNKEYEEILKLQEEQNTMVKSLEERINLLEKNNPGDGSQLLSRVERVNFYKESLHKALEDDKKRVELEKKLQEIEALKAPIKGSLKNLQEGLEKKKEELAKVKEEVEHINKTNLASILASELEEGNPCPVCGSTHHTDAAVKIDREGLDKKEKERDILEKYIEKLSKDINEKTLEVISFEKEKEHVNKEYGSLLKELQDIDIKELRESKEREEREFEILKGNIEKYKKEKESLDKVFICEKDKKIKVDMKETKLKEMLRGEISVLKEQRDELLRENENMKFLSSEYALMKEELKLENIALRVDEIKAFEKEAQVLQKEQKEKRTLIESMDKEKEVLLVEEKKLDIELERILQSGREKKKIIEEKEEEINKLSNGKSPQEYVKVVEESIEKINKDNEILKTRLEEEKNKKQQIHEKRLSLEEAKKILNSRLEEQNKRLLISLEENEFQNEEEVLRFLLDEPIMARIKEEICSFEDDVKDIKVNINRVEGKLGGEFIEEEKWEELKNTRIEKEKLLNIKIKEIATLQKIIEDLKNNLEDLKELRKREKELDHKLSLLSDLGKLVEGNKFVEFVAMSQLKYIAREASRRLKNITKERYALEIDSEGNFAIRDDFNGGEIRDTSTLSGGETFLASLALALSLSSQVQLKGSAPLEFFFLDEGFGTLDTELLDTVMTSIERLHSSRLSVGIISHVEELKNRVPVKLIVTPAKPGEGGSKVALEYS